MIAGDVLTGAAYDKEFTEELQHNFGHIFRIKRGDPFYCYHCDCKCPNCYKVLLRRTMLKPAKKSRLTCPAHDPTDAKASSLITHFMEELMKIDCSARVIWDSNTVPGQPKKSIDATVVCGGRCVQFEVDGDQHFRGKQIETDRDKNRALTAAGRGLLRLHYNDKSDWGKYIADHLKRPSTGVQGSASYKQWAGLDDEPTLVTLGSG